GDQARDSRTRTSGLETRIANSGSPISDLESPVSNLESTPIARSPHLMVGSDTEAADAERIDSYVVFELAGERYALEVGRVQEVLDVGAMTKVPGGAESLRGLFNLRGHVVPVWDLRVPFGLPPAGPVEAEARAHCVLMVESPGQRSAKVCGLLVDRVSDVLEFLPEDLQPVPSLGLGKVSPFVRGLFRHQEHFLLVLELDRIFAALAQESGGDGA